MRNIGAVDIERTRVLIDFPDVPVPASQLVALQKRLKQAKAQLERKATKPAKRKVSSLERNLFLAKRCSVISGSKKRQDPTERDLLTAKRSMKLSKRPLSTRLGASEEDKQLLTEQPTYAQYMVKKRRSENLSLKIRLRNIEQTQQNAKKQNEELKTVVKRLQEEQFSYSNLIKKPNTFKYLCGLSIDQCNILCNCVQTATYSKINTFHIERTFHHVTLLKYTDAAKVTDDRVLCCTFLHRNGKQEQIK